MHLNGKNCKMSFERKTNCRQWVDGLRINDSEENGTPGAGLPQSRVNIHVYNHDI